MTDLIIRALRPEDRPQWAALWRAYLAYYETTLPDAIYDSTFARLLGEDSQDFSALVA
ncbi:MAG: GNAT family N-acetyltransferase, partial [Pseudodonghicola sp.]|nr:GNAT family N-acetyltransferase [Pseudodonghicola sp.]